VPSWRLVHRFLQVEISPDGALVASVEGDSPVNGYYPSVRELVIRRVRTGAETKISLPCDLRDILAGIDAAEKVAPIDDTRLGITVVAMAAS
jgi:hypothetical protein